MGLVPVAPPSSVRLPAPWFTATAPVEGSVEVVRDTVVGPIGLAVGVAWAFAAAAVVVLVATVVAAPDHPRAGRQAWAIALAASLAELGLLLLDGGLTDRRPTASMARVLLLAIVAVTAELPRWAQLLLAGLLALTVPLGAPQAGDLGGLVGAVLLTSVGVLSGVTVTWVARRRDRWSAVLVPGLVAVLAIPAAVVTWPSSVPVHRAQQQVAGTVLDVTVAPVETGRNELHLYARDTAGRPVELRDVHAEVGNLPPQELFPVTADHWLSYVLELPPGERWRLTLAGVTADGGELAIVLDLGGP
jgi:hypothetical protein